MSIDPDIIWYYEKGRESERLDTVCKLEGSRTRHILSARLQPPPLSIVDIGGGAGAYSFWLTQLGYSVHLIDPIQLHIEQAKSKEKEINVSLAGIRCADAENLPFENNAFDAALLFGPLYHLIDRSRRLAALRETGRVLNKRWNALCCSYQSIWIGSRGIF